MIRAGLKEATRRRFSMADEKTPANPKEFLQGNLTSRHVDELFHQGLGLQMLVRQNYDPHPSTGACTAKMICTASILCLITEGAGRTGCEPSGIFRGDCAILNPQ
jgi:hypothetical protein